MDAIVFITFALVLTIISLRNGGSDESANVITDENINIEDTARVAKLNDSYYEDPNAFTEISKALGFR